MSASHVVGREIAPRLGPTKDQREHDTNCLPAWHTCCRLRVWQCSLIVLKARLFVELSMGTCTKTISWDHHNSEVLYPDPGLLSSAT